MVKRIDRTTAGEVDKLNGQDAAAVLTHFQEVLSSARPHLQFSDDLIGSLSDAYENRRARQVSEWERRQHVSRAL